ncbi:SAM-dependent methyltransferase [Gammaproteobacteria bacterium ESL0073]|nr:SAM-dependent methyltransferase [Gammaproteobacteria bacterium ESL0073]
MEKSSTQTINDIDFGALYRNHFQRAERKPKTAIDWDEKSVNSSGNFAEVDTPYVKEFVSRMDISEAETLLDIGCGGGVISLAIAAKLKKLYALDFSAGMLALLAKNIKAMQVNNITPMQLAWEDNWDSVPVCDICVASRSTMVDDLEMALNKINQKTKKRAYLTMTVGQDFIANEILECIGRKSRGFPNYIYAVNILAQQGYNVKVDFIEAEHSPHKNKTPDLEGFIRMVQWSVGYLSDQEIECLIHFYMNNVKSKANLFKTNKMWAFLSWNK